MTSVYVKFEVPEELMKKTLDLFRIAKDSGKVRRGTNEVTKSVEREKAKLVAIALDVDPPEIVMHLPILCDEKKIPYTYVSTKKELGEASGINVNAASACIEDEGEGKNLLREIIEELKRIRGEKVSEEAEQKLRKEKRGT